MKYALVTGSTKGIGLSISTMLIKKGFFVFMNYAHDDAAANSIELTPDSCRIIKADLSTLAGATTLIESIHNENIMLDCLVLNAGTTSRKPFGEIEYDDWNAVLNTNVTIPFLICQNLSAIVAEYGSIVFIGSDMGIYPHAVSPAYSVSKAATHMLARCLVKEFSQRSIRVNTIAPGFIDTEWQKEKPDWLKEKISDKIALRRFGTPEEVADAVIHVIENTYINGAVLQIDGGYDME